MPDARDKEQRVRERAYRIWEEEGRPIGKEKEHLEEAGSERVYDFSSDTIDARWQSGASDMSQAIAYYTSLNASPELSGLHPIR
jgi:hypothetical protein